MKIKNKKSFNNLIKSLVEEVVKEEEEELEEITATGDIEGYSTPNFLQGSKGKKKIKKISTNSTGYKVVKEALEKKDIEIIKKIIRDVVGDVFRDIWLKRNSWK